MKKLIQICSFLSLVFVLSAVSASAQTTYGSEVEIPFSFSVNDRSYEAGKYIVKLSKLNSGAAAITVTDPKTDTVQTVLARRNGDNSDESVRLVFETTSGQNVLSRIITPGGGFAVTLHRQQRDVATRKPNVKPEAASVTELF